jgi:hypothetical protein
VYLCFFIYYAVSKNQSRVFMGTNISGNGSKLRTLRSAWHPHAEADVTLSCARTAVLLSMHLRSFFIVQLSSMITGWCAIAALAGPLPKGTSVFSAVLLKVAGQGTGQAVLSALLLSSGKGSRGSDRCV